MEAFAQKVLTLTRTRPIFDTLLLESHTPDGLAIIPFALAALSGCTLLLLQLAPIKFLSGRKSEVDDRKVRLLLCAVRFCHSHLIYFMLRLRLVRSIFCGFYLSE